MGKCGHKRENEEHFQVYENLETCRTHGIIEGSKVSTGCFYRTSTWKELFDTCLKGFRVDDLQAFLNHHMRRRHYSLLVHKDVVHFKILTLQMKVYVQKSFCF